MQVRIYGHTEDDGEQTLVMRFVCVYCQKPIVDLDWGHLAWWLMETGEHSEPEAVHKGDCDQRMFPRSGFKGRHAMWREFDTSLRCWLNQRGDNAR